MSTLVAEHGTSRTGADAEKQCRVWIIEDHASLRQMLEFHVGSLPGFTVAGASVDEIPAIEAAERSEVDVVLLDLMLPGRGGMHALRRLGQLPRAPRVVIFSATATVHSLRLAIALGAFGYVDKADPIDELQTALLRVRSGGVHFSNRPSRLLTAIIGGVRFTKTPTDRKELQVLELLAGGHSLREVATELQLSKKKIYGIRRTLMSDARAHSTHELVRYAREIGLNADLGETPVNIGQDGSSAGNSDRTLDLAAPAHADSAPNLP